MRNIHTEYQGEDHSFVNASHLAKQSASENQMLDPTIMARHQSGGRGTPALYDGADPETWWAKYYPGNGGKLEIYVGEDYQVHPDGCARLREVGRCALAQPV